MFRKYKHILSRIKFSRKSCCLRDNVKKCAKARQAADDNIRRHTCIECCKPYTTDTHAEYIAFPRQQWLREGASVLLNTYIALLIFLCEGFNKVRMF